MIAACWLVEVLCGQDFDSMNRVRYNFFGSMLPFGMGLLYARHGTRIGRRAALAGLALSGGLVWCLGFTFHGWLWCPLFVVTGAVCCVRLLPQGVLRPLVWTGSVSAAMFVVHPIMREIIIPMSFRGQMYAGLIIYVTATVLLSWAFLKLLSRIPSPKL